MKRTLLPSAEYLRECFLYYPETGRLIWKQRPDRHFKNVRTANIWNARFSGKDAFCGSGRYREGQLDSQHVNAHRVIYKLMTGEEPPLVLDHEDRNKHNNCWENIRPATYPQNGVNVHRPPNAAGFLGVHKHSNKNRWVAQGGKNRKNRYIGIFDSPEKAAEARQKVMEELYGEFAP